MSHSIMKKLILKDIFMSRLFIVGSIVGNLVSLGITMTGRIGYMVGIYGVLRERENKKVELSELLFQWPLDWLILAPILGVITMWALLEPLALILAITLTVLLVSYHYLVRPSLIGKILNGHKYPRSNKIQTPDSRISKESHSVF